MSKEEKERICANSFISFKMVTDKIKEFSKNDLNTEKTKSVSKHFTVKSKGYEPKFSLGLNFPLLRLQNF